MDDLAAESQAHRAGPDRERANATYSVADALGAPGQAAVAQCHPPAVAGQPNAVVGSINADAHVCGLTQAAGLIAACIM